MLPPFRVKQLVPSEISEPGRRSTGLADGVVKMSREAYDALLQRNPQAALNYIDEEDGDVIMVGSALELSHRLQEPVPPQPRARNSDIRNLELVSTLPLHSFNINRQEPVLNEWRALERETRDRKVSRAPVAFGEASPLAKNAPKLPEASQKNQQHAQRWASYAEASGVFERKAIGKEDREEAPGKADRSHPKSPTTTIEQTSRHEASVHAQDVAGVSDHISATSRGKEERSPEEFRLASYNHDAPVYAQDGAGVSDHISAVSRSKEERSPEEFRLASYTNSPSKEHVMSATLQVSSTPKQRDNYQPLLDLFQDQLSRLGTASPSISPQAGSSESTSPQPASAPDPPEEVLETAASESQLPAAPRRDPRLAESLRSIMAGVGQLTSALQLSRNELHNTINLARQDFPNGLREAVKASAAAVDALRGLPAHAEQATARSPQEPATSTNTAASAPVDQTSDHNDAAADAEADAEANAEANAETVNALLERIELQQEEIADLRRRLEEADTVKTSSQADAAPSTSAEEDKTTNNANWVPERIVRQRIIDYQTAFILPSAPIHEYLVHFEGRSADEDIWYEASLLTGVPHLMTQYLKSATAEMCNGRGRLAQVPEKELKTVHHETIRKPIACTPLASTSRSAEAPQAARLPSSVVPSTLWESSAFPARPTWTSACGAPSTQAPAFGAPSTQTSALFSGPANSSALFPGPSTSPTLFPGPSTSSTLFSGPSIPKTSTLFSGTLGYKDLPWHITNRDDLWGKSPFASPFDNAQESASPSPFDNAHKSAFPSTFGNSSKPAFPSTFGNASKSAFPSTLGNASKPAFPDTFGNASKSAFPSTFDHVSKSVGHDSLWESSARPTPLHDVSKSVKHDMPGCRNLHPYHASSVPDTRVSQPATQPTMRDTAVPRINQPRYSAPRPWAQSEDDLLRELTSGKSQVQLADPMVWGNMAKKFIGRLPMEIRDRSTFLEVPKPPQKPQPLKPIPIWAQQAKSSRIQLGTAPETSADEGSAFSVEDSQRRPPRPIDGSQNAGKSSPSVSNGQALQSRSCEGQLVDPRSHLLEAKVSRTKPDSLQPPLQPEVQANAGNDTSSSSAPGHQIEPPTAKPFKEGGMSALRRRHQLGQGQRLQTEHMRTRQAEPPQGLRFDFEREMMYKKQLEQIEARVQGETSGHRQELAQAQQRHLDHLRRQQAEQAKIRQLEQEQQSIPAAAAPAVRPPPIPAWLATSLTSLRSIYPQDSFHAEMSHNFITKQWQPVIKCDHCPSTGKTSHSCLNQGDLKRFERLHLGSIAHKLRVQAATTGKKPLGDRMAHMSSDLQAEPSKSSLSFTMIPPPGMSGLALRPQSETSNDTKSDGPSSQAITPEPQVASPYPAASVATEADGQSKGSADTCVDGRSHPAMRSQETAGMPSGPSNRGGALADFQLQLMLLEQQNKRRLMMARQEHEAVGDLPNPAISDKMPAPTDKPQDSALADFQMQLLLLEQQNKRRLMKARQEQDAAADNKLFDPRLPPSPPAQPPTTMPTQSSDKGESTALADYQMQCMLVEQQNKRRLMMARQEQETREQQGAHQKQENARQEEEAASKQVIDLPSPPTNAPKTKVEKCVETLTDMGFQPAEKLEAVAAACNGDLFTVIELLEEDEREWKRREKGKGKGKGQESASVGNERVPGSWDEDLYASNDEDAARWGF